MKTDFIISKFNNQMGFETVIPLKNIKEGKHVLQIDKFIFDKKTKNYRKSSSHSILVLPTIKKYT